MFAHSQVVESSLIGESLSRVRKVESNVDSSEQQLATDFLFGTADDGAQRPVPRIRGVRLDRTIGEGAFGVVWLGEQFDPVVRPVAVKILRVSSLGAHGMRRFEAEKTALARLEHPHIAHILDAGTASDGSPFLVMEFVEGTAFDAWCHRHRDSLPTRIRMLVLICRAIAYAHRQGILHRDLKPANVLVRAAGGIGESGAIEEPKIIDFGVAKLIGFDALRTETMQRPTAATPAYMSPEVAVGSAEIDGRVDVWSLGVMLFEALVGSRPFHTERSGMAGALDLQRQITELRAKRPSDALAPSAPRALRIALEDDPHCASRSRMISIGSLCAHSRKNPRVATSRPTNWPTISSDGSLVTRCPHDRRVAHIDCASLCGATRVQSLQLRSWHSRLQWGWEDLSRAMSKAVAKSIVGGRLPRSTARCSPRLTPLSRKDSTRD
ncbi:MAG: serine/threonine protein kinase [Planctomycetota bacterium]|nr:MAG: serine/threonine protein kinase [Planctomycetota bacterium]